MCGRTTLTASPADIARWLGFSTADWQPRYNLCPGQELLVVRLNPDAVPETVTMRWGLIPAWATDAAIGNQCINARAETVATKPAFRDAFRSRRCLIVVNGWYEWTTLPSRRKQPHAIRMPDGAPFAVAGLWERWRPPPNRETLDTCTIVTTRTCKATAHLHHRMPIVLAPNRFAAWLDPRTPVSELTGMLQPYDGPLDVYPVPALVNTGAVDGPRCLERVTDEGEPTLWQ